MEELQWRELLGGEEDGLGGSGERTRGCEGVAGGAQHLNLGSPGGPRARWAAPWPEGEAFSASGLCVLKSALELLGKLPGMGATVIAVAAFFISPCPRGEGCCSVGLGLPAPGFQTPPHPAHPHPPPLSPSWRRGCAVCFSS